MPSSNTDNTMTPSSFFIPYLAYIIISHISNNLKIKYKLVIINAKALSSFRNSSFDDFETPFALIKCV